MLRFPEIPDRVFIDILHAAIQHMQASLQGDHFDATGFSMRYPLSARVYVPDQAFTTLGRLLRASQSDTLYEVTDYHWLLLYEALKRFSRHFNDEDGGVGRIRRDYGLRAVDFDELVDLWFWDQDFLLTEEELDKLDAETQGHLAVRTASVRLVQGLRPRRQELTIKRASSDRRPCSPADPFPFYRPGSTVYPDYLKQVNRS
jgi:hypothetical protein